jgi:hypothetical protein
MSITLRLGSQIFLGLLVTLDIIFKHTQLANSNLILALTLTLVTTPGIEYRLGRKQRNNLEQVRVRIRLGLGLGLGLVFVKT